MGLLRRKRAGKLALQDAEMGFQRHQGTQGRDRAPCIVGSLCAGRRLAWAQGTAVIFWGRLCIMQQ